MTLVYSHSSCLVGSEAVGKDMGQNTIRLPQRRGGGLPLQTSLVTVEALLAVSSGDGILVLPESVIVPSGGQRANTIAAVNDPQRIGGTELCFVVGTIVPPVSGCVDHWVAIDSRIVGLGEVVDPANDKCGVQAITIVVISVVCQMYGGRELADLGG